MSAGTSFEQWGIVLIPFPFTDLSGAKKRPALIVSTTSFNAAHQDLICCLMTSNTSKEAGCPLISEKDLAEGRLAFESKIKPYRLFTIDQKLVLKNIGLLGPAKARETRAELIALFTANQESNPTK